MHKKVNNPNIKKPVQIGVDVSRLLGTKKCGSHQEKSGRYWEYGEVGLCLLPKRKQSDQNSRKIKNKYSMSSKYSKYAVYLNA